MIDHTKVRREGMRWCLILTLYNSRPSELCEEVIQQTVRAIYPDATEIEVRKKLDYLASRDLVVLRKEPSGRWWASLTRHGVDLAEYTVDCQPGIGRPVQYWGH